MGPELAAALVIGGTAASMAGQRRAEKQRRAILNRQLERTDETSDRAAEMVAAEGQKYAGDQRMQDLLAQEEATYAQGQQDLQGAGAGVIDTAGADGNVSADFLRTKADRTLSEGNRMTAIARELAKTRAPGQLMTTEGMRRADMTGNIGSMWSKARNLAEAGGMDAQSVTEPWWGTVGKIAQAAGMAGLTGGAGAGAGAATYSLPASAAFGSMGDQSYFAGNGGTRTMFGQNAGQRMRFGA